MIQRYRCTKCRQSFGVRYAKHAYFWQVYMRIVAAHKKASPDCAREYGVERVRLLKSDHG